MSRLFRKLFLLFFLLLLVFGSILSLRYFNTDYKWWIQIIHNSWTADWKIKSSFSDFELDFTCNLECDIPDLFPWKYYIFLNSSWYKEFSTIIEVENGEVFELSALMEKDIKVEYINDDEQKVNQNLVLLKNKEKIWDSDVVFFKWNQAYFIKNQAWNSYFSSTISWDFDDILLPKDDYNDYTISDLEMAVWEFFLSKPWLSKKFIVDTNLGKTYSFNFNPEVRYVKKLSSNRYLLISESWAFYYDSSSDNLSYNSLFEDFVELDGEYIWVVRLWTDYADAYSATENSIYRYNISSKQFTKLWVLPSSYEKIVTIWEGVYIFDKNWKKYLINNL